MINRYLTPLSILVAGVLIAGAVVYTRQASTNSTLGSSVGANQPQQPSPAVLDTGSAENVNPVNEQDHIRGNPAAPVKLVEFSDLECPFCKSFHPTAQQIVDDYPDQVAWVYRHFPLDAIHSKARQEAVATECANELEGNDKFWEYTDKIFEITPSNDGLDLAQLPQIAQDIGLNRAEFAECFESGKFDNHIQEDADDAVASGGSGTPYSVVIAANGKTFPVNGAQPYSAVKSIIDLALKEK